MSTLIGIQTLIITVIILLLTASWRLYQKRKYYRGVTSKLPTLYGIPFIGVAYEMLDVNKIFHNMSMGFDKINALTGCIWVATTPYVLSVDPEVIKHVVSSPEFLNKATDEYTHFQNGLFNGLIVTPAKQWKADRKIISPFFAHNNIVAFFPAFNGNAISLKNKLERLTGQGEQHIFTIIKECGLQLSLLTIMDLKVEECSDTYREIMQAFNNFIDHMGKDFLYGWFGLAFLSRTPHYNRVRKYLKDLVQSLTKTHLALQLESNATSNIVEDKQPMIDITVKALRQGLFSEKQVVVEGFTMLAASYETSVGAVYTCLLMLAMHPEIQERVFQEIRSVFPNGVITVEYEDLKKLPYLDMFVLEALRLAPPVPFIGRKTFQDSELCPGVILPKGARIIISIYELHRRKEIWGTDSSRFNPDNFLPENIAKRHPYSYMPFSKGSRNCIGFRYVEISLRIILIHAVRSFKFSTTFKYEDIVHVPHISLHYKIEPPLSIEVRAN
ncbi:probable cytochrome P450 313a4 isoform X1 [Bactrocera dorsalis]|uniref:Probable cytochrome P450 313a4 isoform X1 n=1 Tax=Bactrocera dorsalis TaxID=27457 RepID=A0ABM3J3Q6_BACDO|nr:probable cytochrome P450 313a4 isoform X1 [Bactrocera dorsalis]